MSKRQPSIPRYLKFYLDHLNGIAVEIVDSSRNFLFGDIKKISGYKKNELNNASSGTWELLIDPVSQQVIKKILKALASGKKTDDIVEYRITEKNGGSRWVREIFKTNKGPGESINIQSVIIDITYQQDSGGLQLIQYAADFQKIYKRDRSKKQEVKILEETVTKRNKEFDGTCPVFTAKK